MGGTISRGRDPGLYKKGASEPSTSTDVFVVLFLGRGHDV